MADYKSANKAVKKNRDEMKPIVITFKEHERWLYDYITEWHSSPASWFKDFAIAEYKKGQNTNDNNLTQSTNTSGGIFDLLD